MNTAELLSVSDREVKSVEVKGGSVHVRGLSAGEQIDMEQAMKAVGDDAKKLLAIQLQFYLSDESGAPVLTSEQAEQFMTLRTPLTIRRLIDEAGGLNGWSQEAREAIRGN